MISFLTSTSAVSQRCSFLISQTRCFSKYVSKSRAKRLPLTTKRAGKGYNKGNGARRGGVLNSKGNFVPKKELQTELVVPDFTNFKLSAYIASGVKKHIREPVPPSM
mmetsp:Transcript_16829/g.28118  ORF Transcript_16829/g.28118 Transcript_16829/m.28118 type:complete len:107 (+) Transcript_16829:40-360(+)